MTSKQESSVLSLLVHQIKNATASNICLTNIHFYPLLSCQQTFSLSQHIHFPRNKKYLRFLENEIFLWIWKYFSICICINCQTNVKEFKQYFVRAGTALSEFMYVLKIFTCYKWGASFLVSVLVCFLRSLRTSSMKTLCLAVLTLLFMFLLIVLKVFALNRDYCDIFVILASNRHNSVYSLRFWHCQSTRVHLCGLCCVNSYLDYNGVAIHTQLGASYTIIKIFPKWYKPFNIIFLFMN